MWQRFYTCGFDTFKNTDNILNGLNIPILQVVKLEEGAVWCRQTRFISANSPNNQNIRSVSYQALIDYYTVCEYACGPRISMKTTFIIDLDFAVMQFIVARVQSHNPH